MTMNPNVPNPKPSPFTRWATDAQARGVDQVKIVAAGLTYEAIEAARAIALSLLPPEKVTPAHVVEIAKVIFEVENSLLDRGEEPDETEAEEGK